MIGDGLMGAQITHQKGDGFGGEVVEPDNGAIGRCRGAEVEVVQCGAVRLLPCATCQHRRTSLPTSL